MFNPNSFISEKNISKILIDNKKKPMANIANNITDKKNKNLKADSCIVFI